LRQGRGVQTEPDSDINKEVNTNEGLRAELRQQWVQARLETDRLFQMLAPGAMYERPIAERHRVIFYLGHLEAFDWNMIAATSFELRSLHPHFDRLFEFGIDPVDGKLPADTPGDWPSVDEVIAYSTRVRSTIDDLLDRAVFQDSPQPFVNDGQIFRVAIEHRLMHAETLAYMFHWLDYDRKRGPMGKVNDRPGPTPPLQCRIPAGIAELGQDAQTFGWDNEFRAHSTFVPEFSIDAFNVTNADFLEFVRAGGYEHRSLWETDDWNWIRSSQTRHPKFWLPRGRQWFYRTMFEEIPLPLSWPVYVSHAEAGAYARWKNKSLPTETQYHRAALGSLPVGNFGFKSWTPQPVGMSPDGASSYGVYDLVGNGWEWTSTPFAPFEGFEPFPFYPGYSANFFDGKHFVMKGASPRTAAQLARKSFRNWFQPHYPNVYATFRCVQ
jgi:gamma-glutamyl hercynylcysteine S-oxide synthase